VSRRTLREVLRDRWFGDTTKYHYGVFRVLFVGGFFLAPFVLPLQATRLDVARAMSAETEAYTSPVLLLRLLHLPLSADATLAWLMLGLAITAIVGIATRVSLIGVAALYLYLGSTANSYGFIAHDTTVPALVLVVLAACPGVTSLSVDAWLRARGRGSANWTGRAARVPVWPARAVLVLLALAYFASGYAKVREAGWEWANGTTLQAYLTDPQPAPYLIADPNPSVTSFRDGIGLESFAYSSGRPKQFAIELAEHRSVMAALSTVSLLWELTFPLVLVSRRLLFPYLAVGALFHLTVALALGLTSFYTYPLTYLMFVNWNALWDRLDAIAHRARRPAAVS
jgi:hypothetical protein